MVYRCLCVGFLTFLLAVVPAMLVAQPVVHQLTVSDGNQTQYILYNYDTEGRLLYERIQSEEDGIRTNLHQTEWINSGDTLKIQRRWDWKDGKWVPVKLIRSRYADAKKYSEEHILLDKQDEKLIRRTILETTGGIESEQLYQREQNEMKLIQITSKLSDQERTSIVKHTYFSADTVSGWLIIQTVRDSVGRIDSLLTDLHSVSDSTHERMLTRYFYINGSSPVASQVSRRWHPLAMVWENEQRVDYVYRPDGQIESETCSYFRELRWLATHRYTYSYYPDGVLKEKVLSGSIYRQWRKLSTASYTDLSQGYPRSVRSVYNFWGGETGSNASTDLVYYFNGQQQIRRAHAIDIAYQTPNDIDETDFTHRNGDLVYPNPTNGILFLRETGTVLLGWEVYDMQGRKVLSLNSGMLSNRIDLTTLPSGMYLVRVTDSESRTSMQKITKN